MLARLFISLTIVILQIPPAFAQSPQIPRPDTLGARFDHAAVGKGTPLDYAFLEGQWTVRYQARDTTTGKYGPVLTGVWSASKTHETLVTDEFNLIIPAGARTPTMTYRVFNASKRIWEVQGVNVGRGVWQPGVSWSDGRDRFLVQQNPATNITIRVRYYDIRPDHFLWRADGSKDGGKTWTPDVILIEATRRS